MLEKRAAPRQARGFVEREPPVKATEDSFDRIERAVVFLTDRRQFGAELAPQLSPARRGSTGRRSAKGARRAARLWPARPETYAHNPARCSPAQAGALLQRRSNAVAEKCPVAAGKEPCRSARWATSTPLLERAGGAGVISQTASAFLEGNDMTTFRRLRTLAGLCVLSGTMTSGVASAQAVAASAEPACIGIVLPAVQGIEGSATDFAVAMRDLLVSYLTGPAVKAVPLDTKLASQAGAEAQQKNCSALLVTTLTRKRGGSGSSFGRIVGQAGSTAAWYAPVGSAGAAAARSAAAGAAHAVSELASGTRAKDEMKLEYQVNGVDGRTRVPKKEEKSKATVDGEDLITPLVGRAAEGIVAGLTRK